VCDRECCGACAGGLWGAGDRNRLGGPTVVNSEAGGCGTKVPGICAADSDIANGEGGVAGLADSKRSRSRRTDIHSANVECFARCWGGIVARGAGGDYL